MKVIEAYLTPNKYSRPQTKLICVKGLVVHWFANPRSTGMANRNFFENRKFGKTGYGSAHDIIDLNGDLIRCLLYDEEAYQVGSSLPYKQGSKQIYTPIAWEKLNTNSNKNIKPYPNNCTIGVECSHLDWDGNMTPETVDTLFHWCLDRCKEFNLTADDIYLHQEIVGWKQCHMYYVKNPQEWIKFKQRVRDKLNEVTISSQEEFTEEELKMIQELQAQVQALTAEVQKLKEFNSMSAIPAWATEAVKSCVDQKILANPNGRSYDLYSIITILHRKGLI